MTGKGKKEHPRGRDVGGLTFTGKKDCTGNAEARKGNICTKVMRKKYLIASGCKKIESGRNEKEMVVQDVNFCNEDRNY